MIIQFTTMSGINTPIDSDNEGKYACIIKSTIVTKVAITIIKIGMRMESGISFLNKLMMISLITKTKVIAVPMPNPLNTLTVTASEEHSPMVKTKRGFPRTMPLVNVFMCVFIIVP